MGRNSEQGSSTAEVAVLLPAVAGLLVLCLATGAAGATQLRLEEAARASARELARGQSPATAVATARRLAGRGVDVSIGAESGYRSVRVSTAAVLPWLTGPGRLVLSAEAEARSEGTGAPGKRGGR